uniref:RNase H type-1 domain-containing protein n=1 Tax=Cannabis sativa TaxID=3483 RepID=A0A803PA62_CANSA
MEEKFSKVILCKAFPEDSMRVLDLLHKFEEASSPQVNLEKSNVFFSANVAGTSRLDLCNVLQIAGASKHGFLKDRIRKRVQDWDGKLLSYAGKEVLIKTVAQSLPTLSKAHYFLKGNFLSASLGNNPSFLWKCVFESHELLKSGVRWAIGSGGKVGRLLLLIFEDGLIKFCKGVVIESVGRLFVVLGVVEGSKRFGLKPKPQENTSKVTIDVAIFCDRAAFDYDIVDQDSQGELVMAQSDNFAGIGAFDLAEAIGIKEALSWIKIQSWQKVELESDCLVVVQAIRNSLSMLSSFRVIIEDCFDTYALQEAIA